MQAECGRGWGLILPLPLPSPLPSQSCGCCCRCHRRCCRRCRRCCCCSAAAAANCCCLATTSCYWLLQWADLQRCHIQQGASSQGGSSGGHSVEGNGPSGHCRSRDGQQVQIDHQRAQECRPPRAMGGGLGWAWVGLGGFRVRVDHGRIKRDERPGHCIHPGQPEAPRAHRMFKRVYFKIQ